ncbi:hypothetical protein BJ508DRAFT_332231 [Ascobolus immersus RN42]|uniref:Uncharacterized protein n=1 Tax=Ascobolus immersus RN42 TaxID=1160509 RepID=A0A3N4HND6_ASCIM|nr:hypothetical protein BJ508DRAFT_332231 [Ascobolus immersus RN42]
MPSKNNINKPKSLRRVKPKSFVSANKKVSNSSLPRDAKKAGKGTLPRVGGVVHGGKGHSLAKAERKKERNQRYAKVRAVEQKEKEEGDVGMNDADDVNAMSKRQRKKLELAERNAKLNKKPEEKTEEKTEEAATGEAAEETMDVDMDGIA